MPQSIWADPHLPINHSIRKHFKAISIHNDMARRSTSIITSDDLSDVMRTERLLNLWVSALILTMRMNAVNINWCLKTNPSPCPSHNRLLKFKVFFPRFQGLFLHDFGFPQLNLNFHSAIWSTNINWIHSAASRFNGFLATLHSMIEIERLLLSNHNFYFSQFIY